MAIVTVLGSCISACIYDKKSRIGGMNHFMLPNSGVSEKNNPISDSMRYGSYAMEVLINQILKNGGRREYLEAKVFGGGNVLKGITSMKVGERNAEFVLNYLKAEGIRITGEDLVDTHARKVCFFPQTGDVFVKTLNHKNDQILISSEEIYSKRLNKHTISGNIEIFKTQP